MDARMLSALVAGVRRAFPFVAADAVEPLIDAHADALFRVCHTASFGVAVQCLMLLFQLMAARRAVSDRFYRSAHIAQGYLHRPISRSIRGTCCFELVKPPALQ